MHVNKLILLIVLSWVNPGNLSGIIVFSTLESFCSVAVSRGGALGRVPVLTGRATVRQFAIVNDIEICLLSKNSKEFFSEYYGSV